MVTETINRECTVKTCQCCNSPLSPADLVADPYVRLCLNCWHVWEIEAGQPLRRYGPPRAKSVFTACGMVFGGVIGFDRHRANGRCLSPAELRAQKRPLTVKDGIWIKYLLRDAFIPCTQRDSSDFQGDPLVLPLPDPENALKPTHSGEFGHAT